MFNKKEYIRQWQEDNPEKVKKYKRQWAKNHPEHGKQYYIDNREEIILQSKQWYKDNPEKAKEARKRYWKNYQKREKERNKQWRKNNPEYMKEYNKKYYQTLAGKLTNQKHSSKRRKLGFIPLNKPFVGYEAHHISQHFIIYMPKELHQSLYHSIWTWQGMNKINELALQYL